MLKFTTPYCSAVLAASVSIAFTASIAAADVSNIDVWGNWRGYMEGMGYSITASETAAGNTLTITDIKMTVPQADGIDEISVSMPSMTMVEQGDGTVRVSLPAESLLTINAAPEDSESVQINLNYAQDGFDMLVSGDAAKLDYAYSANSVTATLVNLIVDGIDLRTDLARAQISVADVTGRSSVTTGSPRQALQTITTGALNYNLWFKDPDTRDETNIAGGVKTLSTNTTSTIPTIGVNMQDMTAMLDAGFRVETGMTYQDSTFDLSMDGPDGDRIVQTAASSGTLGFLMSADGVTYDLGQTDLAINALMPELPLPLVLNMTRTKLNFSSPIPDPDQSQAQDFTLSFSLSGITASDQTWDRVDPNGQLPRDPAAIALDLSGKAQSVLGFINPTQDPSLNGSNGAYAVAFKNLMIQGLGAQLSGAGAVAINPAGATFFGGIPRPEGKVDIKLVGGKGLLNKLATMGLISQKTANGIGITLALISVPTGEPDTLTSRIEINDQGHIIANGQRVQ